MLKTYIKILNRYMLRKILSSIGLLFVVLLMLPFETQANIISIHTEGLKQNSVTISNVRVYDNVKQNGKTGILVKLDCNASGYRGYPLYFYSYFLHGFDYSYVESPSGKNVHGFSTSTVVYDQALIKDVSLFVSYKDLPSKYHGYLIIKLVVYDGFDNVVCEHKPIEILYSTL